MRKFVLILVFTIAHGAGLDAQTSKAASPPPQFIPVCTCGTASSCTLLTATCKLMPLSTIQVPGPQGVQGIQGPPGLAATIAVGTTTTLPAGTQATVFNSGTANAAIFDFGIPQGDQGNDGTPGPDIPGLTWQQNSDGTTSVNLHGPFSTDAGGNTDAVQIGNAVVTVVNGHLQCTITTPGDCNPVVGGASPTSFFINTPGLGAMAAQ